MSEDIVGKGDENIALSTFETLQRERAEVALDFAVRDALAGSDHWGDSDIAAFNAEVERRKAIYWANAARYIGAQPVETADHSNTNPLDRSHDEDHYRAIVEQHGLVYLLDHLGLDDYGNEVNELKRKNADLERALSTLHAERTEGASG